MKTAGLDNFAKEDRANIRAMFPPDHYSVKLLNAYEELERHRAQELERLKLLDWLKIEPREELEKRWSSVMYFYRNQDMDIEDAIRAARALNKHTR